jgi:hypothetical protein
MPNEYAIGIWLVDLTSSHRYPQKAVFKPRKPMTQRIAGTCYFKIDGQQLETTVDGEIEASLLNVKRETIRPGYFKETEQTPSLKGSFLFTRDFPIDQLNHNTDMTITTELANGKVITLSSAYVVGDTTVKNSDGTTELTFEGRRIDWS